MGDLSAEALAALKSADLLRPQGVDGVWDSFLQSADGLRWSRAFSLVVLGSYVNRICRPAVIG